MEETKYNMYIQWNIIQPLKGTSDINSNMIEPGRHYARGTEGQILYDSTYKRYLKQSNS